MKRGIAGNELKENKKVRKGKNVEREDGISLRKRRREGKKEGIKDSN